MFDWGWRILFLLVWGTAFSLNGPIYSETGFSLFLINSFGVGGAAIIQALLMSIALVPLILKYSGNKNKVVQSNKKNLELNKDKIKSNHKIITPEKETIKKININDKEQISSRVQMNLKDLKFEFVDYKNYTSLALKEKLKLELYIEKDEQNDFIKKIKDNKVIILNKFFYIEKETNLFDKSTYYQAYSISSTERIIGLSTTFNSHFTFSSLSKAMHYLIENEIPNIDGNSLFEQEQIFILHKDTELNIYTKEFIDKKKKEDDKRLKEENKILQLEKKNEEKILRKKLSEVKKLYDDGLITEEVLKKKQEEIMGLKD